jgi:hypothetical protein
MKWYGNGDPLGDSAFSSKINLRIKVNDGDPMGKTI